MHLRTHIARLLAALAAIALLAGLAPVYASPASPASPASSAALVSGAPAALNHATIVVQFGDGRVELHRISFSEAEISGLDALRRTGLLIGEKDGVVAAIGGTGCATDSPFCGCPAPFTPCLFWGYSRHAAGVWSEYTVGAAQSRIGDGAVEGWSWGRALPPYRSEAASARLAAAWLESQRRADGSLSGSAGLTIDGALAATAIGADPALALPTSDSALSYLRAAAPRYARASPASAGKLLLGVAAAGADPLAFGGLNLVISTTASLAAPAALTNWDLAFGSLGLRAAGESIPAAVTATLVSRANADGGWGYAAGGASDADSASLAIQGLIVSGEPFTATVVLSGLAYLDATQNADGGWGEAGASNANSTAYAIQALLAAGQDPLATRWSPAGTTPIGYLLPLQQPDGAFTYGGAASELATLQAIPALVGQTMLRGGRQVALRRGLAFIGGQQRADGGFAGFGYGSTIDAILAIQALGGDVRRFTVGGKSPLDGLAGGGRSYAASGAAAGGKLLAGVVAAGGDPRSFIGMNLVISATARYRPATGGYGTSVWDQSWSMIGLAAAGETVPLSATQRLTAMAATGGGWGFAANETAPDADSTGLALLAIAAAAQSRGDDPATSAVPSAMINAASGPGSDDPAALDGIAALRRLQGADGAWGFDGATSASSTGLALAGLNAFGEDTASLAWTRTYTDGARPALPEYRPSQTLLSLQSARGGFAGFAGPDDPDATYQALLGLSGRGYLPQISERLYLSWVGR